jgi:DNA-binding MarR family transcriptional regulator
MPPRAGAAEIAPTPGDLTDAVLAASRVLIAVAARSLAAAGEDVTLVQYRALVVLGYNGPQRIIDLAGELAVNSSTATRLVARLTRKNLVGRSPSPLDRRATVVEITPEGRQVVEAVMAQRRSEMSKILRRVPARDRRAIVTALDTLTRAAGEAPEQSWTRSAGARTGGTNPQNSA